MSGITARVRRVLRRAVRLDVCCGGGIQKQILGSAYPINCVPGAPSCCGLDDRTFFHRFPSAGFFRWERCFSFGLRHLRCRQSLAVLDIVQTLSLQLDRIPSSIFWCMHQMEQGLSGARGFAKRAFGRPRNYRGSKKGLQRCLRCASVRGSGWC
jgi:hypothetical protein